MIDIRDEHLRIVKQILSAHVPDCEVRAFGSRVTGKAKSYSDLDLAIVGKARLDFDTLRLLDESFENCELPFRVDVLDWRAISDSFRRVIEENFLVV